MKLLDFEVGIDQPFFLIAGPCVIESEALALETATYLKKITEELGINFIYKSSYDKANRTSTSSFRGLGIEEGLRILQKVKDEVDCKVLTDVHEDTPLDEVASVVDMMQTPAFLVRQTNFIQNVCKQGIPVNIKKGQFQAPWDMSNACNQEKWLVNTNFKI
jgi:2-dehydro-3-deoxyphosphooctonate aldolase (KDO 8-P synthase)